MDNKDTTRQYYENIILFLERQYDSKLSDFQKYNKWYRPIMKKVIKKEIESIQKDITYYKNLISEYQKRGLL